MNTSDMNHSTDTIVAMRQQEETGYLKKDFFHQQSEHSGSAGLPNCPLHLQVDIDCRSKMIEWCYQVVSFCNFDRETVEIAMSYLDRFMLSPNAFSAREDRTVYQLAAMTALYTACKIHEPVAMDPKLVSSLSRGAFTPEQVEAMEQTLLAAVQWRLNPPTSLSFARQFLTVIPDSTLDPNMKEAAYDLARFQSELAIADYQFIEVRASTIAFCSLMNALECLNINDKALGYIGYILAQSIGIDCNDAFVIAVQNRLYEAIVDQPSYMQMDTLAETPESTTPDKETIRRSSFEGSPRSISAAP